MSVAELEVMPDTATELAVIVKETAIAPETAASLQTSFAPLFREAQGVLEKSRGITVTDASQKLEIKLARECRLALKSIRVNGDKVRKQLKEDSLRRGKAVDGFFNILLHLTESEEKRLQEQEDFAARKEAERKAALKLAREQALAPYGLDTSFMALAEMPDETFAQLLENTRAGHEAKLAAERKAQEEKIRIENERLKEEARIREENARLQREAQEREAARIAEVERLAQEMIERDRIAAEERRAAAVRLKAEQDAAAKAKAEAEAREKAAKDAAEAEMRTERARLEAIAAAERAKAAKAAQEAEAKAKAERDAAEEANRKERLRLQALAEVERQKQETARKAAEDRAAAERAAREKLELEAAMRAREEAARKEREAEIVRKTAMAPDRDKLLALAVQFRHFELPKVEGAPAKQIIADLNPLMLKLAVWLEGRIEKL